VQGHLGFESSWFPSIPFSQHRERPASDERRTGSRQLAGSSPSGASPGSARQCAGKRGTLWVARSLPRPPKAPKVRSEGRQAGRVPLGRRLPACPTESCEGLTV
jgi:hypothetical protein